MAELKGELMAMKQKMMEMDKQHTLEKLQLEKRLLARIDKMEKEFVHKWNEEMILVKETFDEEISMLNERLKKMETQLDKMDTTAKPLKVTEAAMIVPKLSCFDLIDGNYTFEPDFKWKPKITGSGRFGAVSKPFKWKRHPVVASIKTIYESDGEAMVSICLEYHNKESVRDLRLLPNVYYVLRDEYENISVKPICRNVFYTFKSKSSSQYNYKYSTEVSQLKHKAIEVYVEGAIMARQVQSYDGTLRWAVNGYRKRKWMEETGLVEYQESPYFYTGPRGYRVQLHLWLIGYGEYMFKGRGSTARISFLMGEFDDHLDESFPHRTTIALVNRNGHSVAKTVEKNVLKEKSYFIDLCNNEEILTATENDTLTIEVSIEAI